MRDFWERCVENPWVAVVLIICGTILGCALVFGGVSCVKTEYEYKLKRYELSKPQ